MKHHLLSFGLVALAGAAHAQLAVNPQLGANFTQLTNTPNAVTSKAAVGFQLGVDLRLGDRLYFQPGAFFGRSATVIEYAYADTAVIEDNLIRTTAKVKALLGYNLVDAAPFRLRVNVGPTYDVLLSVDSKDDKIDFNKDDYNSGSFNMDAGLGVDISLFTLEAGVSYGLSNAYKDAGELSDDSKYFTYYATLGIVLGSN
jgi:hypothetical protein